MKDSSFGVSPKGMGVVRKYLKRGLLCLVLTLGGIVWAEGNEGRWLADPLTGIEVWDPDTGGTTAISWSGGSEHGRASGPGVLSVFDQCSLTGRYVGTMRDGRAEGAGKVTWVQDGEFLSYIGLFENGTPHGDGTMTYADGSTLKSQYVNGEIGDYGVYRGANGERYDGDLADGVPHGEGLYVSEDGEVYQGDFVEGKRSGEGELLLPDGTMFTCEFEDDELSGFGKAVFPDGGTYEGQFKDDMATGNGTYRAPDGTVYEGQFLSNKPDGRFKVTRPDETTAIEVWKNGEKTIW